MKGPINSSVPSAAPTPASHDQPRSDIFPTASMSFKMPALNSLPSFSGGNFPQWLRSLKLHLRVGNDQRPQGTVISPPAALMVQVMETKTTGDASAIWNSELLQAILAKEDAITDDDLNTVIKTFSECVPTPISEPATVIEEPQQENFAIQLKNLSQGKDMSHQDYYKQARAIMDLLGLEDVHYGSPKAENAEPLSLIQKAIVSYYVQGIDDEQIQLSAYFGDTETLGDTYELVRKAVKEMEEERREAMNEQEEMLTMLGMTSAEARNVLSRMPARRDRSPNANQCNPQ